MTRRQVLIDEAVSLSAGKYMDDPAGLAGVMRAIDALAEDARPAGSFSWGSTFSRLHIGPYRVLYEIGDTTVWVRRLDRVL